MSLNSSVSNIVIEPVDATFGSQHLVCFDTVAGSTLAGEHCLVSSLTTDYNIWFDDGVASDPAVAGRSPIEVTITGSETAVAIAGLIATAINAGSFGLHAKAVANEAKVLIEVKGLGEPKTAAAVGTSTFTVEIVYQGSVLEMGFIEGDVSVGIEPQTFDIQAHQTGGELLGQLLQSVTVGPITLTLKETQAEKLQEFLKVPGQEVTPPGVGATEVIGIGALAGSKQFSNTFDSAKMLLLHPTKKDETDRTTDFLMWKAYPKINSLNFSGEEDRRLEVEFQVYLDQNRLNGVSKLVFGDWQQNFLKG